MALESQSLDIVLEETIENAVTKAKHSHLDCISVVFYTIKCRDLNAARSSTMSRQGCQHLNTDGTVNDLLREADKAVIKKLTFAKGKAEAKGWPVHVEEQLVFFVVNMDVAGRPVVFFS